MATSKYISDGYKLDYTPSSDVTAGDVVVLNSLVCHAPDNITATKLGHLQIEGIVRFPKDTGSGTAMTQGAPAYWDAGNEVITLTASTHELAGYIAKDAATTDSTVHVKLAHAV